MKDNSGLTSRQAAPGCSRCIVGLHQKALPITSAEMALYKRMHTMQVTHTDKQQAQHCLHCLSKPICMTVTNNTIPAAASAHSPQASHLRYERPNLISESRTHAAIASRLRRLTPLKLTLWPCVSPQSCHSPPPPSMLCWDAVLCCLRP